MFDAVRNNKKIVQVFLALIALPFAFFGVESYMRDAGTGGDVAKIGDIKISQQQFQQALRDQQERLSARIGKIDPKIFDTPEARKAILNDLIDQRLIMLEAGKLRLSVGDGAIRQRIGAIDAFQVNGQFSKERYESELRRAGFSPEGFEAQLRQDLTLQQLVGSISQSAFVSSSSLDRIVALQTQGRDIQEHRISVDGYLAKVQPNEDAIKQFYEQNSQQFEIPEQVKAEYLVLGKKDIANLVSVSESEIKEKYESQKSTYETPESRRASHILLTGDKAKSRTQGESLLKEIAASPKSFPDLAKKYSQDPGSAEKGGDLGFFGPGMMVKPFEEAVFSMKEGQVSGLVESDFGIHIIKLTGIRSAKIRPLSEVRGEIESALREVAVNRKFDEVAENFSNLVYEQADSLKPAAEKFKLGIRQTDWISRKTGANGPVGHEKVLSALFSEDSIKNRRNTEAIDVGTNTLLAARIVDYKPATKQSIDTVRGAIESLLKRQEAHKLAVADGEALLGKLKAGEDKLAWSGVRRVMRQDPKQVSPAVINAVFKVDAGKLPGYVGVEAPGSGYSVFKIVKVEEGEALDPSRRQPMRQQLSSLAAQEEFQAYLQALRSRYKVEINVQALEAR